MTFLYILLFSIPIYVWNLKPITLLLFSVTTQWFLCDVYNIVCTTLFKLVLISSNSWELLQSERTSIDSPSHTFHLDLRLYDVSSSEYFSVAYTLCLQRNFQDNVQLKSQVKTLPHCVLEIVLFACHSPVILHNLSDDLACGCCNFTRKSPGQFRLQKLLREVANCWNMWLSRSNFMLLT